MACSMVAGSNLIFLYCKFSKHYLYNFNFFLGVGKINFLLSVSNQICCTVWRTWHLIACSDESWSSYQFSMCHSYIFFTISWENPYQKAQGLSKWFKPFIILMCVSLLLCFSQWTDCQTMSLFSSSVQRQLEVWGKRYWNSVSRDNNIRHKPTLWKLVSLVTQPFVNG